MNFKHRLKDIVVRAVMLEEPVVIVEGKDDRQIYQKRAQLIPKKLY
jgi:esterase/lipase